jgi:hypothetical protein
MSDVETALTGAEVAPVANAETPQATQAPEPTTENEDTQAADKPRDDKGRFVPQERVNEITRARREAERRADALERELAGLRQQPAHQPRSNEAPPSIEQFQDVNEWSRAMVEYATKQAEARVEERFRGQEQQRSQRQVIEGFEERSRKYEAEHPGFDDRVADLARNVQFNPYVVEAIGLSEHGPAVVDYLATHLDEADRIARMAPHIAALSIGRIEAQVSAPKSKPVTNAPNPAPTLAGGGAITKNPENMSVDEWLAWRNSELKKR